MRLVWFSLGPFSNFRVTLSPSPSTNCGQKSFVQVGVSLTGTVKRWDDQKGFGFIVPDGGGPDVSIAQST